MKELLIACRMGVRMSSKHIHQIISIILSVFTIAGLISAPWSLSLIDKPYWRVFAWVLVIVLAIAIAVCAGLTPYWGQKEITNQKENWGKCLEKELYNRGNENEKLKTRIKELEH